MDSIAPGAGSRDPGSGNALDYVQLARELIDIESTTGNEGEVGSVARGILCATAAIRCSEQPLGAVLRDSRIPRLPDPGKASGQRDRRRW